MTPSFVPSGRVGVGEEACVGSHSATNRIATNTSTPCNTLSPYSSVQRECLSSGADRAEHLPAF